MVRTQRRQKGGLNINALFKMIGKECDPMRPGYEGERHGVMLDGPQKGCKAQYMGPGTKVEKRIERGDPGINDLDKMAKQHDLSYLSANKKLQSGVINKKEFMTEIHDADKKFISESKQSKDAPITGNLASKAMALKQLGEQFGVLPSSIFSGAGDIDINCPEFKAMKCKCFTPDHDLRQEMTGKKQKGGLAPLAIALISALAPVAVEKLIDLGKFAVKKIKGGALPTDLHKKASMLLNEMPENKQYDLIGKVINLHGKEAFMQ